MKVEISGTPFVAVDAGNQKGGLEIPTILVTAIAHTGEAAI